MKYNNIDVNFNIIILASFMLFFLYHVLIIKHKSVTLRGTSPANHYSGIIVLLSSRACMKYKKRAEEPDTCACRANWHLLSERKRKLIIGMEDVNTVEKLK